MESQDMKLEQIIHTIKESYQIEEPEQEAIRSAFELLTDCLSTLNSSTGEGSEAYHVDRSLFIAQYMASWGFGCCAVIAALLYVLPINHITPLDELESKIDNDAYTVLKGCVNIHEQIISAKSSNLVEAYHREGRDLSSRYPESFYIEVAVHIDTLSQKLTSQSEDTLTFAQRTREILIPQVRYIHAYKMADLLEELCFRIENRNAYDAARSIIQKIDSLNEFSRQKFITKLRQIFDSNSNLMPEDLRRFRPYIKSFHANKRSLVSIYRFITQNDSTPHSDSTFLYDLTKLKNFARTAFYDLTLVVSDRMEDGCSAIDVFMGYFEAQLRPLGIFLYGYYRTANRDACYFLLSDPVKNMYRFFIKTESEYLRYLYGDIIAQDKVTLHQQPRKNEDQIKVFRKDGTAEMIEKGMTVLDFAFMIHKDLGLHFGNAILNQNGKLQPAYTILNNGDTIEIKKSEDVTAELNWFRYVKTELAINHLIKYFKAQFRQTGSSIRILTRGGRAVLLPEGATVLDFAFILYGDRGVFFDHALVNQSKKHYTVDYALYDGDTVAIQFALTPQADFYWFRHVKTAKAIDHLIDYFKSKS